MPPACTVCPHEHRAAIDSAIIAGETSRAIARQHGLGKDTVQRHRECIGAALRSAVEKRGTRLLQRVERLADQLETMADECVTEKQRGAFLMTARELRPTFQLVGQLNGEIMAASVEGLIRGMGFQNETELRSAVDRGRVPANLSLDDCEADGIELLALVLSERPERRAAILSALGGKLLGGANGRHEPNGNGGHG